MPVVDAAITNRNAKQTDAYVAAITARLDPLGVRVERVADAASAAAYLARLRSELGAPGLTIAADLAGAAPTLLAALDSAGVACAVPTDLAGARDAPLGVSLARHAVAETGSVLMAEPSLVERAVGLISKVHVTVVRTESIIPSLDETAVVLRELAQLPGGAYASFVTGPSRTADIEMSLTVGVQGPEREFVLIVDELT